MTSLSDALTGLAKSAVIIFFGTVIGRVSALLGQIVIVRSLSPSSFGTIALAYTGILTISQFGLLGIPEGITRIISAEDPNYKQHDILKSGYLIAFGSSIILASIIYILRPRLADLVRNTDITLLITLFLPIILILPISRVSTAALRAQQRSLQVTVTENVVPQFVAVAVFLGFNSFQRPFSGAVAYWLVIPLTSALLALVFLSRNSLTDNFRFCLPKISAVYKLWSFSWPLAVGASLILLMSNLDVLMIGYFLDSEDVGFYRSVQPLRQVTQFVLQSFLFLFLPLATTFYSNNNLEKLRTLYTATSKWAAVLTLPPVLVFSLFAQDVVRVFFGVEYLPGAPALSILTAGLFFNVLVGPNGAMIQALDRPRLEMYAATAALAVNILLNIYLIPLFGIVGAASATVIGYIIFNLLEVSAIYSVSDANPFSLNTLKPLTITTVVGIAIARFTSSFTLNLPALIGIGLLLLVVQAGAITATRSVGEADIFIYQEVMDRLK